MCIRDSYTTWSSKGTYNPNTNSIDLIPNTSYRWTEPVKFSGKDGANGADGADGNDGHSPYILNGYWYYYDSSLGWVQGRPAQGETGPAGPALTFRGEFSSSKTYYWNEDRRDVVKYNGQYYIVKSKGSTDKISGFKVMSSFEMVATDLLLAQTATTVSYTHLVMIDSDRAVTIRSAKWQGTEITAANASTVMAGLGNTPIMLWLEDKWFGPGAILEFDNREYQVRVSGAPYQDGNEWVYTCFIADGQSNSYIPGEYLLAGRQVSRLASAYEEYSEEGDILNYNTHFKMRNFLFTTRLDYDITAVSYTHLDVYKRQVLEHSCKWMTIGHMKTLIFL